MASKIRDQITGACFAGVLLLAVGGAILGGHLAWAAPLYKTCLAEISGCISGLFVGCAAWTVVIWLYNTGYHEGDKAARLDILSGRFADKAEAQDNPRPN